MVERMVRSTSSSSNVQRVLDDNSNRYRMIVMDAMKINQGYACECLIIDEEPNTYATNFF